MSIAVEMALWQVVQGVVWQHSVVTRGVRALRSINKFHLTPTLHHWQAQRLGLSLQFYC